MIEQFGDVWTAALRGKGKTALCITTNGYVKKDGTAVMGRGIAAQAKRRIPNIEKLLGVAILDYGNRVQGLCDYRGVSIIAFPVKHNWFEKADLDLIGTSVRQLKDIVWAQNYERIFLPRPGCNNGKLDWKDVRPLLAGLDDRYIIYARESEREK